MKYCLLGMFLNKKIFIKYNKIEIMLMLKLKKKIMLEFKKKKSMNDSITDKKDIKMRTEFF